MNRPTISDLAEAAGVSVSTVNRILGGSAAVRQTTLERVRNAADQIGFYGVGTIDARKKQAMPRYRLGFLLQQPSRELYQLFGSKIREAALAWSTAEIEAVIEFVEHLEPENIAARLSALGNACDATAIIAADHPLISQSIQTLRLHGKPVVAYITDQSSPDRAGYVGTDNWKLGRTAAWFIAQTACQPGHVCVFIGNHRYQCQDISDASFRSYMREHAPHLIVDDSLPTHEEPREARDLVLDLLEKQDDLVGIYVAGGGISGVLEALRSKPADRQKHIRVVCRDIGPETRRGLAEGLITAALCHPLEQTSRQLIQTLIDVMRHDPSGVILQRTLPFEIITPESL